MCRYIFGLVLWIYISWLCMLSCSFIIQILCEHLWFHSPYGQGEWSVILLRREVQERQEEKKKKLNLSFNHPNFTLQLIRMTKTVQCESSMCSFNIHSSISLPRQYLFVNPRLQLHPGKKERKEKKWLLLQMCGRCLSTRCWIPQISQHNGVFLVLVCAGCCSTSYDDLSKVSQSKFVCLLKCSLCVCVLCRIFFWSAEEVALGWQASC